MNDEAAVDARHPWLGLAAFTEDTRGYFFGRETEVAELGRRVQRKTLTVLFGQSGTGKTSVLRAGLVPRLKGQGYCPVYVRIDHAAGAPEPAEQIKKLIADAARAAGAWTQAGSAVEDESLWEFLHHRDDVLRDAAGGLVIPLLIFDQFEEVFTLAQSDDAGRRRAAHFLGSLADLVENRAPPALEHRMEADERIAETFDFSRTDYRVLIALREDYLAPLENLKASMPSVTQNRLRLAPLTGAQALEAVVRPGEGLVSTAVACAIVRFVAGGADLDNAQVEPALLSLICRELNDARLAQGGAEIGADLLEGSQATILSNFYERSLADQSAAARHIIEDDLLTASGFRENIAEERLLERFKGASVPSGALATLVDRRVLRIEERLDVRRVELTHDVLCGVVKASRDLRQEREAKERAEGLLAEQQQRERAARVALMRARKIAALCALLTLAAVIAAVFAVVSTQRARRAEGAATQTRDQAEHLLAYLGDDFAREFETFGRLEAAAGIAKREIDYFDSLPAALRGPNTTRSHALALTRYAAVTNHMGDLAKARVASDRAVGMLDALSSAGDRGEATTIALARALDAQSSAQSAEQNPASDATARRGLELIEPFGAAADASPAARRALARSLISVGFSGIYNGGSADSEKLFDRARRLAAGLRSADATDLDAAVAELEATEWRIYALNSIGRQREALALSADAEPLIDDVLEQRPNYGAALLAAHGVEYNLAETLGDAVRLDEAAVHLRRSLDYAARLIRLDPNVKAVYNNQALGLSVLGAITLDMGDGAAAIEPLKQAIAAAERVKDDGAWWTLAPLLPMMNLAIVQADLGDDSLQRTRQRLEEAAAALHQRNPVIDSDVAVARCITRYAASLEALARDDYRSAQSDGLEAIRMSGSIQGELAVGYPSLLAWFCNWNPQPVLAEAAFMQKDYARAERVARAALAMPKPNFYDHTTNSSRRDDAILSIWLALSLVRQGRLAEAQQILEPQRQFYETALADPHGSAGVELEHAAVLYALGLSSPAHKAGLLRDAATRIDKLPAPYRALRSVQRWRARLHDAGV